MMLWDRIKTDATRWIRVDARSLIWNHEAANPPNHSIIQANMTINYYFLLKVFIPSEK